MGDLEEIERVSQETKKCPFSGGLKQVTPVMPEEVIFDGLRWVSGRW
jgi:hypothetical protein